MGVLDVGKSLWDVYRTCHVIDGISKWLNGTHNITITDEENIALGDPFTEFSIENNEMSLFQALSWSINRAINEEQEDATDLGDTEWTPPDTLIFRIPFGPSFDLMSGWNVIQGTWAWISVIITNSLGIVQDIYDLAIGIDPYLPYSDQMTYYNYTTKTLQYGYDMTPPKGMHFSDLAKISALKVIFKYVRKHIKDIGKIGLKILHWMTKIIFGVISASGRYIQSRRRLNKIQGGTANAVDEVLGDRVDDILEDTDYVYNKLYNAYSPQKGVFNY